jgi:exodeoxyribonuclease VII large subunit
MLRLNKNNPLALSELTYIIRESIASSLPESYWVVGEITGLRVNQKGHCYLELVERDDDSITARMSANIWAYDYRKLAAKFLQETKAFLKDGMKVLFLATVNFHEVYGLSLNIIDIDPAYTLGDIARKKREIIARLEKERLIDLNKSLPLPLVPQRIAIVSSHTAAGYDDFISHMENNSYGYKFHLKLFQALMQGDEAESSMIGALRQVITQRGSFDLAVLIRGGGSQMDLSCFDSYELASEIARLPLPVITGIGHERDDTIADMVAHTRMKTPTAVAEFIISGVRSFEERVIDCKRRLVRQSEHLLKDEAYRLKNVLQELTNSAVKLVTRHIGKVGLIGYTIKSASNIYIERRRNDLLSVQKKLQIVTESKLTGYTNKLNRIEQAVHYLDPVNILKRGYSITHYQGRTIKNIEGLARGETVKTRLYHGAITSKIEELEAHNNEAAEKTGI